MEEDEAPSSGRRSSRRRSTSADLPTADPPSLIRSDTPLHIGESAAIGFTTPSLLPRSYHESVSETDRSFRLAAGVALVVWTSLLYLVLTYAPTESYDELDPVERMCTTMATAALGVSNLSRVVPLVWRRRANAFSGIIVAACAIQFIAVMTNAIMLAVPTPVMIDPVTKGRVHLLRWVEWAPLAAVMTFLTEGVDVPHPRYGTKVGLYHGMAQGIATTVGLLFPFVPNRQSWFLLLAVACTLFCSLYVRIYQKRRVLSAMDRGRYADEVELYDRAELSLRLMTTCAVVWTLLILLYFFGWAAPRYLPHVPIVGSPSLPMLTETSCELVSKVLYLTIIVDVHDAVFDESSRANRRLRELRYMMSAVWDSSSDVIAISIRNTKNTSVTTMVSPTFAKLEDAIAGRVNDEKSSEASLDADNDSLDNDDFNDGSRPTKRRPKQNNGSTKALVFELDGSDMKVRPRRVSSFNNLNDICDEGESFPEASAANDDDLSRSSSTASEPRVRPKRVHFIELKGLPTETGPDVTKFKEEPTSEMRPGVVAMGELLVRAWSSSHSGEEVLLMHDIVREEKKTGEVRHIRCEAKVTRLENDAILVVVRDISERFRRFEAEKRVVMEKTARTKDAEANRFTRHEVKNGLLAAIGLCDSLREAFGDEEALPKTPEQRPSAGISSANAMPVLIEEPKSPTDAAKEGKEEEKVKQGGEKTESQVAPLHQAKPISTAEMLSSATKAWKRKLHDASGHEVDFDIRRCTAELDSTLREVLDTILAQSMARDVMHGIYEPKLERVKMESALYGVRGASTLMDESNRFPLLTHPQPLPEFLIDPQLLRFIHRNATSNACKYGKRGGTVLTEIKFHKETSQLSMDVTNHPGEGHDEILQLGRVAEQAVFDAGRRLHPELGDSSILRTNQSASHSAGDGAWIMKKCANALGGDCRIKFEPSKTTFTLTCPIKAIVPNPRKSGSKEFRLPSQTWGIAIDDSKIQRKLLGRFLGLCGVDKEKTVILGETTEEIMAFEETVCDIVRSNPDAFMLVIVDENLDVEDDDGHKTVSGSLCVEGIRRTLSPEEETRVLALVRSANDSSEDIAIYRSRAHGYLLKAPVKKDAVLDSIAPWWTKRFHEVSGASITSDVDGSMSMSSLPDDIIQVSSAEIMQTLEVIDALCRQGNPTTLARRWPIIWEKLHVLKGDMKTLKDNVRVSAVLEAIDRLQGSSYPEDFLERWQLIKSLAVSTM